MGDGPRVAVGGLHTLGVVGLYAGVATHTSSPEVPVPGGYPRTRRLCPLTSVGTPSEDPRERRRDKQDVSILTPTPSV